MILSPAEIKRSHVNLDSVTTADIKNKFDIMQWGAYTYH